jgi:hypothetical protein
MPSTAPRENAIANQPNCSLERAAQLSAVSWEIPSAARSARVAMIQYQERDMRGRCFLGAFFWGTADLSTEGSRPTARSVAAVTTANSRVLVAKKYYEKTGGELARVVRVTKLGARVMGVYSYQVARYGLSP